MEIKVAFIGFNPICARLAECLADDPEVSFVGVVADEAPAQWPDFLPIPPLFSSDEQLIEEAVPGLLLVAEDVKLHEEKPDNCQVIRVSEEEPLTGLLDALARRNLYGKEMEEEVKEIASLCASVNVIEAYSDPMPKLTQLLDRAVAISGADMGMILLPGEVLDELRIVISRGVGSENLVGRALSTTDSLCGSAFDEGKVKRGVLEGDAEELRYMEGSGIRGILAMPMRAEGRVMGIFTLGSKEHGEFDALKMSLLTLIADQAGLAMQISHLYSELESNVIMDATSGLYNQSYFHQRLGEEISRARRYSLNLCLAVMEFDQFHDYLDRNGRFMGDLILSDMGNIIRRNTREVDASVRYGEDRFAILLPETRRLGAMRLSDRIRKVVEEYPFPSRQRKEVERLSICVGISSFPASADNEDDLWEKAVTALNVAKEAGPNNIRLYSANLSEEGSS